jgi:HEXXH motif-containing protein
MRPVRGIFHAAYTFAFRAELLERIAAASKSGKHPLEILRLDARGIRTLRGEAARERRWVARSLRDLAEAARMGLLTSAGRRVLRSMSRQRGLLLP